MLLIGDRVKIIKTTEDDALAGFEEGDVVTVINTRYDGIWAVEVEHSNGTIGFTDESNLKPLGTNTKDVPNQDEFERIAKEAIKWLNDNGHPYMKIVIDPTSAELVEGVKSVVTEEFLKD